MTELMKRYEQGTGEILDIDHLSADATVTAGDITFEIFGVPMGLESYGETGDIKLGKIFHGQNMGASQGPIFPYFEMT